MDDHEGKRRQSLLLLPETLNLVLLQTANVFRKSTKQAGGRGGRSNLQATRLISGTIEKFHAALDELEVELLQGKASLGRDLAELRATETNVEGSQAVDAADDAPAAHTPALTPPAAVLLKPPTDAEAETKAEPADAIMRDADETEQLESSPRQQSETDITAAHPFSTELSPPGPAVEQTFRALDAVVIERTSNAEMPATVDPVPEKAPPDANPAISQMATAKENPAVNALSELDFGSMFPGLPTDGAEPGREMALDLASDSNAQEAALAYGAIDIDHSNTSDIRATVVKGSGPHPGMGALVPGLAKFGTAVDDVAVIETPLPTAAANQADAEMMTVPQDSNGTTDVPENSLPQPSTSIDDLFLDTADFNLSDDAGVFEDSFFTMEGS
ncbi:MAG: hypothetical protein M1826_001174 [Phylliscum demangeonii]|nr:MAG: hypothetical protein M1826_001174 [Phylliscum demangeonii]